MRTGIVHSVVREGDRDAQQHVTTSNGTCTEQFLQFLNSDELQIRNSDATRLFCFYMFREEQKALLLF